MDKITHKVRCEQWTSIIKECLASGMPKTTWCREHGISDKAFFTGNEFSDITDDVVFEVELINQIEINIDYILMLVKKYHDTNCEDKEILISIKKAIDASPELRSKKELIDAFINGINDVDDVMIEWHDYVVEMREQELVIIIEEERLKEDETRKFLDNAFREGELKTVGTDIDRMMPPVSRFGGGNKAAKKKTVIDRLKAYFDKFYGVGGAAKFTKGDTENRA